jgi:hypothetical protein
MTYGEAAGGGASKRARCARENRSRRGSRRGTNVPGEWAEREAEFDDNGMKH